MTEFTYNCSECGKEVNFKKNPSTQCSLCRKDFCSAMHKDCFVKHAQKEKCQGSHLTILNPAWVVNLREPKKEEENG